MKNSAEAAAATKTTTTTTVRNNNKINNNLSDYLELTTLDDQVKMSQKQQVANRNEITGLVNRNYMNGSQDERAVSSSQQMNNVEAGIATTEQIDLQMSPNVEIVQPNSSAGSRRHVADAERAGAAAAAAEEEEEAEEEVEEELVLKYGASHVIKLFIPVTLCMLFVIISLSAITSYQKSGGAHLIYTPFNEEDEQSSGTKLWMSIANASIFIGVVVVMTIILILLYKFHCYKTIHGWLAFSSLMLLFLFTFMYISELFKTFNWITDMITICFFLWNFGILGMFCIHWKGPLILQQAFLIFTCVQMALIFIKYLAEWTTWVLLAFISIWDLIAVLCPFGPLRILVETAKSRNDQLFPAMVYSSTIMYSLIMAKPNETTTKESSETKLKKKPKVKNSHAESNLGGGEAACTSSAANEERGGFSEQNSTDESSLPASRRQGDNVTEPSRNQLRNRATGERVPPPVDQQNPHIQHIHELENQQQDEEENGVKLGLGDFIFYSILVGKASILGDWNTVIACFIAILIGLCFTLVLLAIFHKALPALPISLFFGLIFYFLTNLIVRPFYDNLTSQQVFI